jgi:hypothetical protein
MTAPDLADYHQVRGFLFGLSLNLARAPKLSNYAVFVAWIEISGPQFASGGSWEERAAVSVGLGFQAAWHERNLPPFIGSSPATDRGFAVTSIDAIAQWARSGSDVEHFWACVLCDRDDAGGNAPV